MRVTGASLPEATQHLAHQFGIPIKLKERTSQKKKYTPEDVEKAWDKAKEVGEDLYFSKKGLTPPPGVRFGKNPYGYDSVLVP